MRRREFITALIGAASWPVVARAQQSAMPVIGFANSGSREERRDELQGFVRGLGEMGYIEGQSVAIEYRWARGVGQQIVVVNAGSESEIDAAFRTGLVGCKDARCLPTPLH